jgi:hypothetical protein
MVLAPAGRQDSRLDQLLKLHDGEPEKMRV